MFLRKNFTYLLLKNCYGCYNFGGRCTMALWIIEEWGYRRIWYRGVTAEPLYLSISSDFDSKTSFHGMPPWQIVPQPDIFPFHPCLISQADNLVSCGNKTRIYWPSISLIFVTLLCYLEILNCLQHTTQQCCVPAEVLYCTDFRLISQTYSDSPLPRTQETTFLCPYRGYVRVLKRVDKKVIIFNF